MTVAKLIEKLSQYPSGAEVMVRNESGSWVDIGKVDYDESCFMGDTFTYRHYSYY